MIATVQIARDYTNFEDGSCSYPLHYSFPWIIMVNLGSLLELMMSVNGYSHLSSIFAGKKKGGGGEHYEDYYK